ncbi:MAG TPA: hypothetical protein VK934_09465 [Fimbriimonas sp.]|nr:hypothetical protein [Fimbriimonas sp.]
MSATFDPTAPEGDRGGRSELASKKDVRNVLIGLAVITIGMYPVYKMMEKNSERARCQANIKAISDALGLYGSVHDRYPIIYAMDEEQEPIVDARGFPATTWASDISEYMNARASFLCPSAIREEAATIPTGRTAPEQKLKDHPDRTELISYGMYAAYSGFPVALVENPGNTVIVGETSNLGARGSYDPMPFKNSVPDVFVIGWDNSNTAPNEQTKSVTRLAFFDAGGNFTGETAARHDIETKDKSASGLYALTASGARTVLRPPSATYSTTGLSGNWRTPANLGR